MKVKIDTKEKFVIITIEEPFISANMTEEVNNLLLPILEEPVKNVVLNMHLIGIVDETSGRNLADIQQKFYDNFCSFIICELQPAVEKFLNKFELLEILNVTPTESEASDIVQMEEIERDLLSEE